MPRNAESAAAGEALRARDLRVLRAFGDDADGPLLGHLRRVLAADAFALHYQPIVSLADGSVTHHEALLRIPAGDGTLQAPGRYLAAAEGDGLIRAVDRAVLARAVRVLGEDPDFAGARVAVNVSGVSVTDAGLASELERLLAEHSVDAGRLVLELTETAAIGDMARARAFCARIIELGCAIAIDDFGAGFGSFHYLKHLPFDFVKIDGEFIRALPSSRTDQLVVSALAGVVAGLGRATIAEFVGDRETLELLREYGVDYAQGYAVGAPAPRPLAPR